MQPTQSHLLLWAALVLAGAAAVPHSAAQTPPSFEVEWERVGSDDAFDVRGLFTASDSAVYANGNRARYVIRPGDTEVRVAVYDVLGRRVALLHDGPLAAGTHDLDLATGQFAAGVYVVRAEGLAGAGARTFTLTR